MRKHDFSKSGQVIRVYKTLRESEGLTAHEIETKCFVSRRQVSRCTAMLKEVGLCHISKFIRNDLGKQGYVAIYAYGYGVDAVRPTRNERSTDVSQSPRAFQIVEQIEKLGELSLPDVEGIPRGYAAELLTWLKEEKVIHVDRWELHGCTWRQIYVLGPGTNAKRPKALSHAVRSRRRKRKIRELYGPEIAKKIIRSRRDGGADRVVINGITVYERRKA